jgi:hypothetical protein
VGGYSLDARSAEHGGAANMAKRETLVRDVATSTWLDDSDYVLGISSQHRHVWTVKTLFNPFRLFGGLLLFFFKLIGYTITFGIQTILLLIQGRREMIVEAFGWWGRCVTDAVAKILE